MNLAGKNIVVYDLETKKNPDECTNKWASFDEFGISVGCAFDYRENRFRVYLDDNISLLVDRLNEPGTLIVAFNHIQFDNILLRKSGLPLKPDAELNNYDMLVESRKAAKVDKFTPGFKLDDHLKALNLPLKTGAGAMAPELFKQNKMGALVDYCLNDVSQEKALFEWICLTGFMASAHNFSNLYRVEKPNLK